MKKILLFVLLFAFSPLAALAQHDTLPYYVGVPQFYMEHQLQGALHDTVHNGATCQTFASAYINQYCGQKLPSDDVAIRINIGKEGGLRIIGIAAIAAIFDDDMASLYSACTHEGGRYDSIRFRLYQPTTNDMLLLESVVLDSTFDTATCRIFRRNYGWGGTIPATLNHPNNIPVLEVYFDTEWVVTDSLYISCKCFLNENFDPYHEIFGDFTIVYVENHNPYIGTYLFPTVQYRECSYNIWSDTCAEFHGYPLLFPIIRRDCDTCPQVQGLEYVKTGYNRAFFRWQNGTNHHDWQLSYGPAGTAPEDGTIVDCSQRMTGTIEFDPDSHYVAYVRARCRFARYEYGPWSAPLTFSLNGGIDGIDEVSSGTITLTPNPAADRVTVAAEGMESVELIGADGAVLQRRECRNTCVLDLRGLAAGVYMVRVGTATGTATKRLVVQ